MAAAAALLAALATSGPAGAAIESCAYDPVTKRIAAEITSGSEATLKVMANGELRFGLVPAACGGATTTNTDLIVVNGNAGTTEELTVDMSDGFIGPGFSPESNLPEIEFEVNLGDAADTFTTIGTDGDDILVAGKSGFSFNEDGDLDVVFTPLPSTMTIIGGGGRNFITARGGAGAGLAYPGAATIIGGDLGDALDGGNGPDTIVGGAGNDIITGSGGNDTLTGGGGDDRLTGGSGNDTITGGPGIDELIGGTENDILHADDNEADTQIHGGPGMDTAYVDANIEATIAVENTIVDPGPPPPPPPPGGACVYDSEARTVTAGLAAGTSATLAVVGTEIRFGATPAACGGATTTNTNTITITGATGSVEHLIVDQSGGALAPGASAEATGISELELEINLGDASDDVIFHGTAAADTLAMGTKGLSINADDDVDVVFAPMPSSIELVGGQGDDVLGARGGYGSGQVFPGRVTLRGGDGDDTLTGGNLDDLLAGDAGADTLSGYSGNDVIEGGAGDDKLSGQDGNDTLVGGSGADTLLGAGGDDTLDARDGAADVQIHGAQGNDTAMYDGGIDPPPIAVENHLPA